MNVKQISAIILVGAAVILAMIVGYTYAQRESEKPVVTDFASCVSAGYPIMETDPRQCRVPEGTLYVEEKTVTPTKIKPKPQSQQQKNLRQKKV